MVVAKLDSCCQPAVVDGHRTFVGPAKLSEMNMTSVRSRCLPLKRRGWTGINRTGVSAYHA